MEISLVVIFSLKLSAFVLPHVSSLGFDAAILLAVYCYVVVGAHVVSPVFLVLTFGTPLIVYLAARLLRRVY